MVPQAAPSTSGNAVRMQPPRAGVRTVWLALAAVVLAGLSGCASTMYLLQAANGEWHVMHGRRPIVDVIDDPQTPEPLIRELSDVREARRFASERLGLPDNDSYRTYVNIGRRYVVWNVVAAPQFSVKPKQWCFPIAGCVAYRGYFNEKSAQRFAKYLKRRGYDVVVEGVPAYSTLGRLPDPVMSSMMRYGSDELAAMIFHELAHQLLYVRNDSRFDEAFAMTVENEGMKRWLEFRHKPQRFARFEREGEADRRFADLLRRARDRLATVYASGIAHQRMLREKKAVFSRLAQRIRALEHHLGLRSPLYDHWIAAGLNNADLASVGTYYDCLPGFERLLGREGGNLPRFYAAARRLAKEPEDERDARLCRRDRLTGIRASPAAQSPRAAHRAPASAPSP